MKIKETKDLRTANRYHIIDALLKYEPLSRADISSITKLNKGTVSTIVKELLELNLITESAIGDSSGGRKPIMLTLCPNVGYVLSLDINITHITIAYLNLKSEIINQWVLPIKSLDFEQVFSGLITELNTILSTLPKTPYGLVGIGVSVKGVVDLEGTIRLIPKLQWYNIHIHKLLENYFNVPVFVDNDGNFAALAEYVFYPELKDLVVISIDEVISAGIISRGTLMKGFLGFASAIGHHVINFDGKPCICGKKGCLEVYCSYLSIQEELNKEFPHVTIDDFITLIRENHPIAMEILEKFLDHLAIGLTNLIYILNCELIVLNSTLLKGIPNAIQALQKRIVLPITQTQKVCLSNLDDSASLIGASHVVTKGFYQNILCF